MGAILLAVTGLDPKPWEDRFRTLAPQRDIRIWPDRVGEPAEVAYACAWHAPNGLFARFAYLKVIFSLGAGVDHVVADPHLPDVPVVRIVDADLHHADDGVCRAACADASPPPATLRCPATRPRLARA